MNRSNRWAVVVIFGAALFFAGTQMGGLRSADDPGNARLKKLLDDRVTMKRQFVSVLKNAGTVVSSFELHEANVDALLAELDTLETKAQRLGVREKILEAEKEFMQSQINVCSKLNRMHYEARRLDAEVALEREKLK